MTEQVDVVVVGLGVGGEEVGRAAGRGRAARGRHRDAPGRRRVPVLGLRAEQDDDPGGRPARRGPADRRAGRHGDGPPRLGAGRAADPRRGHRQLGRQGRGRPVHRQGRPVRARAAAASPARGRVEVGDQEFEATPRRSCSATGTEPARPADRRARRHAVLDQPRGHRGRPTVPASLIVLGGGAVGLELAQVFARFGVAGHRRRGARPAAAAARSRRRRELAAERAARRRASTSGVGAKADRGAHATTARVHRRARRRRRRSPRDAAAGRHRAARRPRRPRRWTRSGSTQTARAGRGRRPACGPATACGRSATSPGKGAFTHVAMYQAGIAVARHPRRGRPGRGLPRAAAGDVHRPGDRLGRADRGRGPRRGACTVARHRRRCRRRPAAGSTRRATRASSSWSPTPTGACWSARPRPGRRAARCSAPWPSRCTPRCRWTGSAR